MIIPMSSDTMGHPLGQAQIPSQLELTPAMCSVHRNASLDQGTSYSSFGLGGWLIGRRSAKTCHTWTIDLLPYLLT